MRIITVRRVLELLASYPDRVALISAIAVFRAQAPSRWRCGVELPCSCALGIIQQAFGWLHSGLALGCCNGERSHPMMLWNLQSFIR
jgi:hypothetical protein